MKSHEASSNEAGSKGDKTKRKARAELAGWSQCGLEVKARAIDAEDRVRKSQIKVPGL